MTLPPDREQRRVEVVDEAGEVTGACTVEQAHRLPGLLHRAFSVLLLDDAGRLLLQQRAEAKTRFPLRWANACCGHPGPGQPVAVAAVCRLEEELGVRPGPLAEVGVHRYRAQDPTTPQVENEYDHVLVGILSSPGAIIPDPAEVAGVRWITPGDLADDLLATPQRYAPWLAGVLGVWQRHEAEPDHGAGPAPRSGTQR